MIDELEQQIRLLKHGDHLRLIDSRPEEQLAAAGAFMRERLTRNECGVHIADERSTAAIAATLQAAGLPVAHETERGALSLLSHQEAHLAAGRFDPEDRAAALRAAGAMNRAAGAETGCRRPSEALLNELFPGSPALAVCRCDRRRFPPELIRNARFDHHLTQPVDPGSLRAPPGRKEPGARLTAGRSPCSCAPRPSPRPPRAPAPAGSGG